MITTLCGRSILLIFSRARTTQFWSKYRQSPSVDNRIREWHNLCSSEATELVGSFLPGMTQSADTETLADQLVRVLSYSCSKRTSSVSEYSDKKLTKPQQPFIYTLFHRSYLSPAGCLPRFLTKQMVTRGCKRQYTIIWQH